MSKDKFTPNKDNAKTPAKTTDKALPTLTPAQRREAKVMQTLGTKTGWTFVEYVHLDTIGKCEITGGRLKDGVKIKNASTGKTLICGKGAAKVYTDVVFPSGRRAPAGKAKPAAKDAPAVVEEISPDDFSVLDELTNSLS